MPFICADMFVGMLDLNICTSIRYSVPHQHDASGRFKVDLQETKKGFSKKPILQLTAVEQFTVLLSLTDNYVRVLFLKTRGISWGLEYWRVAKILQSPAVLPGECLRCSLLYSLC